MAQSKRTPRASDGEPTSVWLQPQAVRRDPLTRQRIVEVALEVLDADGAVGLTMRRLAQELEVGPATLYGHVRTKEDVLDLALDEIFAEVPLPKDAGSPDQWREELADLLRAWRSMLLDHPWSSTVLGRPQLGPQQLAREERLYALLAASGLTKPEVQDTAYALSNYVIGSVLMQITWLQQNEITRTTAREHIAAHSDLYPTLSAHRNVTDTDWDRSFSSGLTTLLNGIAAPH